MRLRDKTALITGATTGLGQSCAEIFAQEGATLILSGINAQKGQELVDQLGPKAFYHPLDVRNESEWIKVANFIREKFKTLDILVNNAGVSGFVPDMGLQDPEHASLESWHYVHSINLDGVFLGCKHAIPLMKTNGGSIINISSRSGIVGVPQAAAYASSKAAVRNHTKSVALYCAAEKYNIRCNSIHPAAILTSMWEPMLSQEKKERQNRIDNISQDIPLQRMGEPCDVAYGALYLASDESKYLTGIELNIDGGMLAGTGTTKLTR